MTNQAKLEEAIAKLVAEKHLLDDNEVPVADLIDLDYFGARIDELFEAFGEKHFLHAFAIKANSVCGVLDVARARNMGAEAASVAEMAHAINMGFERNRIVFDSPAKNEKDLRHALEAGVTMNLDNETELEMVSAILQKSPHLKDKNLRLGLRINPVVGAGSIASISTATRVSKFGLPVSEDKLFNDTWRERVLGLYAKYEFLNGVHVHVGSQGVPIHLFVKGIRILVDLAIDIAKNTQKDRINFIDIGGGLSTSYTQESEPNDFSFKNYRALLQQNVPELFDTRLFFDQIDCRNETQSDLQVITEFGRCLVLKSCVTLAKINAVKELGVSLNPVVIIHVGANQFIRDVYVPGTWRRRYCLADKSGKFKEADQGHRYYDIAGPLCFQGDYIAKDVALPAGLAQGDVLVIKDTGAYTMAMYSRFNSILAGAVYGFRRNKENNELDFYCLKKRETIEEALAFWGETRPQKL